MSDLRLSPNAQELLYKATMDALKLDYRAYEYVSSLDINFDDIAAQEAAVKTYKSNVQETKDSLLSMIGNMARLGGTVTATSEGFSQMTDGNLFVAHLFTNHANSETGSWGSHS